MAGHYADHRSLPLSPDAQTGRSNPWLLASSIHGFAQPFESAGLAFLLEEKSSLGSVVQVFVRYSKGFCAAGRMALTLLLFWRSPRANAADHPTLAGKASCDVGQGLSVRLRIFVTDTREKERERESVHDCIPLWCRGEGFLCSVWHVSWIVLWCSIPAGVPSTERKTERHGLHPRTTDRHGPRCLRMKPFACTVGPDDDRLLLHCLPLITLSWMVVFYFITLVSLFLFFLFFYSF